jgi:hypothetical protein
MIAAVTLRAVTFDPLQQVLRLVLLLGRTTSTKDVELLVLRAMRSPCSAAPTPDLSCVTTV